MNCKNCGAQIDMLDDNVVQYDEYLTFAGGISIGRSIHVPLGDLHKGQHA